MVHCTATGVGPDGGVCALVIELPHCCDIVKKRSLIIYGFSYPLHWIVQQLYDMPHVSYSASELKPAQNEGNYYVIKKIWDKVKDKDGILWYKVWYQKEKKEKSSWVKATELLEDGAQDAIDEYEASVIEKKKKARTKRK
jgi:hypothetical protein